MNDNEAVTAKAVDPHALQYQEILFSLIMSCVAVLSRDNPLVVYPGILWAFAAMLSFNLSYHRLLRSRRGLVVPMVSMAVNVVLISAAVALSGGDQSAFWPLYLLPVFTACLHLERRHVRGALLAAGAFLAYFYADALWDLQSWRLCEFGLKLCVLAMSAAVTAHLSFKERAHRIALAAGRERIEALALSLERRTAADLLAAKRESWESLVPAIAHELNTPLSVILGSVELLLKEAPEGSQGRQDLERIRAAARRCMRVGDDLRAYSVLELEERK